MPQRIIIANIISLGAAVFLFFSSTTKKANRVYLFGIFECVLIFISQLFFGQGAAAISLLIAAFRNFLLYRKSYTRPFFIIIFFSSFVLGILFNTGGALGLLPVVATLIFNVTTYYAKNYVKVKLSLLLNLVLWTFYSACIFDVSNTIINAASSVMTLVSIIKYVKDKKSG